MEFLEVLLGLTTVLCIDSEELYIVLHHARKCQCFLCQKALPALIAKAFTRLAHLVNAKNTAVTCNVSTVLRSA